MARFSQRFGYVANTVQFERMDDTLRNRIWNKFYIEHFDPYDVYDLENAITNIERMMDKMGILYEFPHDTKIRRANAVKLQSFLIKNSEWYLMYDFIENHLELINEDEVQNVIDEYNRILEEEVSGYRIINGMVASIIAESEVQSISNALNTPYNAVNTHINKALSLFADRKKPDYENSIKESISAVEALCKIIVEDDKTSLGQALRKLELKGVELHGGLKTALDKIYGYTSDENGIRHAGIDFKNAPSEDAQFMLVSCSAFVNYLIVKWEKSKEMK